MESKDKYITPTKDHPVFKAHCDDFGYIEEDFYKNWNVITPKYNMVGSTYATDLTKAIVKLHDFVKSYESNRDKTKYELYMIDGSHDKHGEVKEILVYSITEKKAKQYRLK